MNYFQEYEARRNLYKNIKPGSVWKWNKEDDSTYILQIVQVKDRVVYYRYCNESVWLQGVFRRNLDTFPTMASPFEPVIELAQ
jgi:hypothetical protein